MIHFKAHWFVFSIIFMAGSLFFSCGVSRRGFDLKTLDDVLVLGNSITRHAPAPALGWFGDWGMAASAPDKDYVHIVELDFSRYHPSMRFQVATIVDFERGYWNFDLTRLDSLKKLKPGLIILHIGENVNDGTSRVHHFRKYYDQLLDYFMSGNPRVRVICVSSFWEKENVDRVIEAAGHRKHCYYVDIGQLSRDTSNMAGSRFKNKGVALHPSDRGMAAMAGLIWDQVEAIR